MQPVTFLEALEYAHSKNIVLPAEFYSMDLKTRQMATTVSFLSSLEQIETVIKAVNKSIASGGTFKDFQDLIAESKNHSAKALSGQCISNQYSECIWSWAMATTATK